MVMQQQDVKQQLQQQQLQQQPGGKQRQQRARASLEGMPAVIHEELAHAGQIVDAFQQSTHALVHTYTHAVVETQCQTHMLVPSTSPLLSNAVSKAGLRVMPAARTAAPSVLVATSGKPWTPA
jgi:hypothetical protein